MPPASPPPGPPTDPDPARATPAIGRVLALLRRLIDYGRQLAATAQARAADPDFAHFAWPFGNLDLAAILARITGGLRRAAALEASLAQRAARNQDLAPTPIRTPAARGPGTTRQPSPPKPQPEPQPADPRLARLPTEAEIAAEVRRRPIGAVIADICRDLGITPGQLDRAFWDEISHAIIVYGGSLARFLGDLNRRLFTFVPGDHAASADPAWPAASPRPP
jgi:hypothetical protein